MCAIYEKCTSLLKTQRLNVKGWKIYFIQMTNKSKQEALAKSKYQVLISDKIDFKSCTVKRKKICYETKATIQQKHITSIHISCPNQTTQAHNTNIIRAKGEIDSSAITTQDFYTTVQ